MPTTSSALEKAQIGRWISEMDSWIRWL